jgi:PPK2 family polyphosphate:nucleotide phosphotransferase
MNKERKQRIREFLMPYRISQGKKFQLKDHDPADTQNFSSENKGEAKELLTRGIEWLTEEQGKLYAQDRWSILLIFQAMDAAGKDGTIKHVMSGINPQGVQVTSFKAPSAEDLDHDFMWRCMKALPERGRIGIFNRSYYEEVLVVRVHEALLAKQQMPPQLVGKKIWEERYEDIVNIERYLARNGCVILKFFLNLSHDEQKKRFLERLDNPDKNWKFSTADANERRHWTAYMEAYEAMIRNTARKHAPWYVVPADNKWFARLVVAIAIVDAMDDLDLRYPDIGPDKKKELATARRLLLAKEK